MHVATCSFHITSIAHIFRHIACVLHILWALDTCSLHRGCFAYMPSILVRTYIKYIYKGTCRQNQTRPDETGQDWTRPDRHANVHTCTFPHWHTHTLILYVYVWFCMYIVYIYICVSTEGCAHIWWIYAKRHHLPCPLHQHGWDQKWWACHMAGLATMY